MADEGCANRQIAELLNTRIAACFQMASAVCSTPAAGIAGRSGKPAMERRQKATRSGTAVSLQKLWVMSARHRSGGFCVGAIAACRGGEAGLSVPIKNLAQRRRMLWVCI